MDPFIPEDRPIPHALREAMFRRTDHQLIRALSEERHMYEPEAIRAAEDELERRFPEGESREVAIQKLTAEVKERSDAEKQVLPAKALLLVFILPVLGFFIMNIFVIRPEEKRKMQDAMMMLVFSLVFWTMNLIRL